MKETGWLIDWARSPTGIAAAHEPFVDNLNAFDDTSIEKYTKAFMPLACPFYSFERSTIRTLLLDLLSLSDS